MHAWMILVIDGHLRIAKVSGYVEIYFLSRLLLLAMK